MPEQRSRWCAKGKTITDRPGIPEHVRSHLETQRSWLRQALSLSWLGTNSLGLFIEAQCSWWSPSAPSCGVGISTPCWGV